jgi:hypothetical protein
MCTLLLHHRRLSFFSSLPSQIFPIHCRHFLFFLPSSFGAADAAGNGTTMQQQQQPILVFFFKFFVGFIFRIFWVLFLFYLSYLMRQFSRRERPALLSSSSSFFYVSPTF